MAMVCVESVKSGIVSACDSCVELWAVVWRPYRRRVKVIPDLSERNEVSDMCIHEERGRGKAV
jgi:hypothetical protein